MAPDSVSFRITRNTEDLAQTIHALSQRLVVMEQRLQAMELQLTNRLHQESEPDLREVSSLDNVERLLFDCRALLGLEETEQHHGTEEFSDLPLSAAEESEARADSERFTPPVPFQQAA
jgi:hypothetical protein